MQLDDALHEQIKTLCAQGDACVEAGELDDALDAYDEAWDLLPEPKQRWEAATWILVAIGDTCFMAGDETASAETFGLALQCPGGVGNPFIHLRLGQLAFDADQLDTAADELMRAYMGAGAEIFEGEAPEYLAFLKTRADI
ncbi:hypothetical protein CEK29_12850 [Bordetella genomosp. 5]|uniref:tetratricopeptide repeat protein n=1 Tax=Bordetella genomosp. 5 TaxID=1395608 RepID=UPI000B9DDE5D|nr:hypothetical protein [Bordetella genomosp. 5]OZI42625.1 hypothetical protein CEK29_12850 [Bordetella genomosp. 5]